MNDDFAPMRGLMNGIALSMCFWICVFCAIKYIAGFV